MSMGEIMSELESLQEENKRLREERDYAIKSAEMVISGHNKRLLNYKRELIEELEERGYSVPPDWKRIENPDQQMFT